jgi:hypothetical protein
MFTSHQRSAAISPGPHAALEGEDEHDDVVGRELGERLAELVDLLGVVVRAGLRVHLDELDERDHRR